MAEKVKTFRRMRASTLIKRHLPYCPNCLNLEEIRQNYPKRENGYQPKSYSLMRNCIANQNGELDEYWHHLGAGCPNFKSREGKDENA